MTPYLFKDTLETLKQAQPFLAFTVELHGGDRFVVEDPSALVLVEGTAIYIPPNGEPFKIHHADVDQITPGRGEDKGRVTVPGCIVLLLSLTLMAAAALYLGSEITSRDVGWLHVFAPVLAGASAFGIGTGILRLFGIAVLKGSATVIPDPRQNIYRTPPDQSPADLPPPEKSPDGFKRL